MDDLLLECSLGDTSDWHSSLLDLSDLLLELDHRDLFLLQFSLQSNADSSVHSPRDRDLSFQRSNSSCVHNLADLLPGNFIFKSSNSNFEHLLADSLWWISSSNEDLLLLSELLSCYFT